MARTTDVHLNGISKAFGAVRAVDNVTLEVAQGEFVSLLGPSGCGKTTVLRMVAGFEESDSGDLYIRGERMNEVPPHRRNLGMVFQSYALFPHMSICENIAFGLMMHRVPRSEIAPRVKEAMTLVQLEGMEDRRPSELSGGQQQRVALARALVTRPNVLLLDESLSALDKKLREQMQLELKQLQQKLGITTIFVTHDQEEALTMSDRIAVMQDGRVVQNGTPTEIYERPTTRFVADFIGLSNFLSGKVVGGMGDQALLEVAGAGRLMLSALPRGVSVGDGVEVAVRPEKIRIHREQPASANRMRGCISGIVYLGTACRYYVALPGGQQLIAFQQNVSHLPGFNKADEVFLEWESDSNLVLVPGARPVSETE